MKKAMVLGMGISGKAATQLLLSKGYFVFGVDDHLQIELYPNQAESWNLDRAKAPGLDDRKSVHISNIDRLSIIQPRELSHGPKSNFQPDWGIKQENFVSIPMDQALKHLNETDLFIPSPGVARDHPLYLQAIRSGIEMIGEIELALREIHQPCIGITGTNGKTTVVKAIEHVFKFCQLPARSLGNVGDPLSTYVLEKHPNDEVLIIELSSYQLETMHSKKFDVGLILNITPDHLDRYSSMEEYGAMKCQIENYLKPKGKLFVQKEVSDLFKKKFQGKVHSFTDEQLPDLNQLALHDLENMQAVWCAVKEFGIKKEMFLQSLKTFTKPSHRIEFVMTIDGVSYFDDSKGTNIDAVVKAVHAMKGPTLLIAGGVDKKLSFSSWKQLKQKVKYILTLGATKEKIYNELKDEFPIECVESLSAAVTRAHQLATVGDCVLLSPGCSSFDMFRDYAHRGEEFQRFVRSLLEERRKK